jgi:hypothetical protein
MQINYATKNIPKIDGSIPAPLRSFLIGCNQIHDGEPLVHPSPEQLDSFVGALDAELGWSEQSLDTGTSARRQQRSPLTSWMFGVEPGDFATTQAGEYKAYSSLAAVLVLSSVVTAAVTAAAVRGVVTVSWLLAGAVGILYGAMGMLFGRTLLLPRPLPYDLVRRKRHRHRSSVFGPRLLVRGLLSVFMSATLAQGLILGVYESEISATLAVQDQARVDAAVESELEIFNEQIVFTSSQVSNVETKVSSLQTEMAMLQDKLFAEVHGTGTGLTGIAGKGQFARAIESELKVKLADLKEEKDRLNEFQSTQEALVRETAARAQKTRADVSQRYAGSHGLGSRLRVMREQQGSVNLYVLLMGLLVIIDLFPILARALFGQTTFEEELREEDEVRVAVLREYRHLRLVNLQTEPDSVEAEQLVLP